MRDHYELTIENRVGQRNGFVSPGEHWDITLDGRWRAVATEQPGELHIVSALDNGLRAKITLRASRITTVAFHPAGQWLALGNDDGGLAIYSLDGTERVQYLAHEAEITAMAWNHDGTELATASLDGTAKVFAAAAAQVLTTYRRHRAPVRGIAFAAEGDYVITSGDDQRIHVWRRDRPSEPSPTPQSPHARQTLALY